MSEAPPALGGAPCVAHACRKCCFDTEMPLLESDAARLAALGHVRERFAVEHDGWLRLRNERGQCVFLGPKGCTVHDARPEGCRLYPLVWDADEKRVVLDVETCPFTREFRVTPAQRAAVEGLVEQLHAERDARSDR